MKLPVRDGPNVSWKGKALWKNMGKVARVVWECETLLQNKLGDLVKLNCLYSGGDEKIANRLAKLINAMKELEELAIEHTIEGQLYEGAV